MFTSKLRNAYQVDCNQVIPRENYRRCLDYFNRHIDTTVGGAAMLMRVVIGG